MRVPCEDETRYVRAPQARGPAVDGRGPSAPVGAHPGLLAEVRPRAAHDRIHTTLDSIQNTARLAKELPTRGSMTKDVPHAAFEKCEAPTTLRGEEIGRMRTRPSLRRPWARKSAQGKGA